MYYFFVIHCHSCFKDADRALSRMARADCFDRIIGLGVIGVDAIF